MTENNNIKYNEFLGFKKMEMVYFTVVAIILYFLADSILQQIEIKRGKVFEHRSLIFFGIITTLALISFALIRHFAPQ